MAPVVRPIELACATWQLQSTRGAPASLAQSSQVSPKKKKRQRCQPLALLELGVMLLEQLHILGAWPLRSLSDIE